MSGDVINITIIEQEDPITVNVTEQQPILVNFFDVAIPDPRVAQARTDAEAAAVSAEEDRIAAEAARDEAEAIVAGISTVVADEVTNQLNDKTTDDIAEGSTNLYFTEERARDAVLDGSAEIYCWGDQTLDGSFRQILESGELKMQKRIAGAWVTRDSIT